jgi:hypothetical protein
MTPRNTLTEDMFETARAEFFGTAKTSPQQSDKATDFLKPREKPTPKETTARSVTTEK